VLAGSVLLIVAAIVLVQRHLWSASTRVVPASQLRADGTAAQ
jgi:hypothetical protein